MQKYAVRTRADSPELRKAAMAIEQAAWSSLGFLNFTRAHFAFYQQVLETDERRGTEAAFKQLVRNNYLCGRRRPVDVRRV